MKTVTVALLAALIVLGSVAVYQQVLIATRTRSTQTTTVYSSEPPQLLGTSGFMTIFSPTNSSAHSEFQYFEANSTNQQSFTYDSVNFSLYTPTTNPGTTTTNLGGGSCDYYKVTFQDASSETLTACLGTFIGPIRTDFIFTQHMHLQAGLAYAPGGAFYFLVSQS